MSKKNNIVLIGFATSGKTTVGKLVAKKTKMNFVDLDDMTYAEYKKIHFADNGKWDEELFRKAESAVCDNLDVTNCVVACGGGTPTRKEFAKLCSGGTVVWLKVSAEQVAMRLGNTERPLFDNLTLSELKTFVAKRTEYYEIAELQVDTDNKTPQEVADEICKALS